MSAATGAQARLVELASGRVVAELHLGAEAKYLTAAPDRFGVADESGEIRIVSPDGRELLRASTGEAVQAIVLLQGERWIAVGDRTLRLYERERVVATYPAARTDQGVIGTLSPDGRWMALVGLKEVWLHDPKSPATLGRLIGHQGAAINAGFDAAGTRLVSTSQDGGAIVWAHAQRVPLRRLISRSQYLAGAVFDESDAVIVALDGTGSLQLFDAATGAGIGAIDGRMQLPQALRRSADGAYIGMGFHGRVEVWRIPRDRDSIAAAERDLACKAPPNQVVGACTK